MRLKPLSLLIPIGLVLLLIAGSNATPSPTDSEKSERTVSPQKMGTNPNNGATIQACPSTTVVIKEIPAPQAKQIIAIIHQEPYRYWWNGPNGPAWALFLLTIPYVGVTVGLFVLTRRGQTQLERAWIFMIPTQARLYCLDSSETYALSVQFKRTNTGRSVGWVTGGIIHGIRTKDPLPETPNYRGETAYGPTPVPPNQETPDQYVRLILQQVEAETFLNGTLKIWIVGVVRYRDVFKRPHDTEFCISISRPLKRPTATEPFSDCLMAFEGPPTYNRMT
jgi:hypothetical protein